VVAGLSATKPVAAGEDDSSSNSSANIVKNVEPEVTISNERNNEKAPVPVRKQTKRTTQMMEHQRRALARLPKFSGTDTVK
jgi:hypothetical protein